MGIKLSWIAVKNGRKEDLLERLGLEEVGETSDEIGQDFVFGETATGWSVLVMKKLLSDLDKTLLSAAPKGSSLCGLMTEIVMSSEVGGYIDGQKVWSVVHNPEKEARAVIHGAPPEPFGEIKQRLDAKQAEAGDEQVDYLFDLPMELTASLSGYRPSEGGIAWTVLRRKNARNVKADVLGRSLTTAIRVELLPLLWSLGWKPAHDDPKLHLEGEIVRQIGAKTQTISFEYGSGPETYIHVLYRTTEHPASGPSRQEAGTTQMPEQRPPWWEKFLRMATTASSDDTIDAAIEKAKTDIRAVDDYLTTGTLNPHIFIQGRWTSQKPGDA
jgi:hypothetical protein